LRPEYGRGGPQCEKYRRYSKRQPAIDDQSKHCHMVLERGWLCRQKPFNCSRTHISRGILRAMDHETARLPL